MKITHVTSEVFEWDRPGIWNGSHFYGKGRLHKVTVYTDQGLTGSGWNGGTAANGGRIIAAGDKRVHEQAIKLLAK